MHCAACTVICPPWRLKFRSLIAVALATVFFAVSFGGAGGWSSAFAQNPDAKSASDDKGKTGAKTAETKDDQRGKRAGRDGKRRGKGRRGRRGRRGPATVFVDTVTKGIAIDTVQIYGRVIARQRPAIGRTRAVVHRRGSRHANLLRPEWRCRPAARRVPNPACASDHHDLRRRARPDRERRRRG